MTWSNVELINTLIHLDKYLLKRTEREEPGDRQLDGEHWRVEGA